MKTERLICVLYRSQIIHQMRIVQVEKGKHTNKQYACLRNDCFLYSFLVVVTNTVAATRFKLSLS